MSKKKKNVLDENGELILKDRLGAGRITGRILLCVFTFILLLVAAAYGILFVVMKGPSRSVTEKFTLSARETSAVKWLPRLYISQSEIDAIVTEAESRVDPDAATDTSLITVTGPSEGDMNNGIVIEELSDGNFKGYMMIVSDPARVFVGSPDSYDGGEGVTLMDLVEKTGAVAGINAGGFYDPGGGGNGGTPLGMVINDGELLYDSGASVSTMGIDYDGILHVGTMSAQEAMALDMRCAVSFGPALVVNGEICAGLSSGVNPRTAIGQRSDGSILLLVIDGRQIDSLGADYQDVAEVMLEYGAVNAGNLDGGSSTMMIYNGEIINTCASVLGPRRLPTAFLVK